MNSSETQILLYICHNSLARSNLSFEDISIPSGVQLEELPCSGKITTRYLIKQFEVGVPAVSIIGCPIGECHFIDGNRRAKVRVNSVRQLLKETGLDDDKLILHTPDVITQEIIDDVIARLTLHAPSETDEVVDKISTVKNETL